MKPMERVQVVRVIEIRATENGWVLTAFEREGRPSNDYDTAIYRTYAAESIERAAKIASELMKSETWERAVEIPPARGHQSLRATVR